MQNNMDENPQRIPTKGRYERVHAVCFHLSEILELA